ncbi:MAG: hypothetical protein OEY50_09755 [Nitrospinota bacterium]|nr:hypothetical protein [Nitrospinota bacterium]MDH5679762.1 hypothetical protein [Nitrospinota bacterium]MDH5756999.1 hypothetical protein [Nitrospinota bacterium]
MRKTLVSVCLMFAMVVAISCGEYDDDDDDYGGGGGNRPPIPTEVCDTNCAVPGACSEHGGVNCSAGPDNDASVICNDGYKDSSIKYNCY